MTEEKIRKIINSKKELDDIPVVAGLDFGHTMPMFTFPIGGKGRIEAYDKAKLYIEEH